MQVHLHSKTGPLIPSGDDLLRSLREQTATLQAQWRDRLAHDPAGFARLEVEIHDHFRRLADQMTASLLAQATTPDDRAEPGKKGGPTPPAAPDDRAEPGKKGGPTPPAAPDAPPSRAR